MNTADLPSESKKSVGDELKTIPVGLAVGGVPVSADVGGIVTTKGILVPSARYNVDKPVPLSETQKGFPLPTGLMVRPHGLTRFGSVRSATPAMSLWRF